MSELKFTIWYFISLILPIQCANILILHPIYCGSHEFVLRALGDHLVSRGHKVTQVRKLSKYYLRIILNIIFHTGQISTEKHA